ncbi:MAG: YcxB family protein [Clostridiales bacterium]|jgi:hypothetical protein|nr:YcxB family protein [Clostridiales bacterium]
MIKDKYKSLLKADCEITLEDYIKLRTTLTKKTRVSAGLIASSELIAVLSIAGEMSAFTFILMLLAGAIIMMKPKRQWMKEYRNHPLLNSKNQYKFYEEGFSVSNEYGFFTFKWSDMFSKLELAEGFLIFKNQQMYYFLPMSSFAGKNNDAGTLRKLLEKLPDFNDVNLFRGWRLYALLFGIMAAVSVAVFIFMRINP